MAVRIAALVVLATAVWAAPAAGAEFCVGVPAHAGCEERPTLTAALADALDGDAVHVGGRQAPQDPDTRFADGGRAVAILGAGDATLLAPLELTGASRVAGLRIAAGVPDALTATAAAVTVDNVDADGALVAGCDDAHDGSLLVRGVTATAVRAGCATGREASAEVRSSILTAEDPFAVSGGATITSSYSAHAEDADVAAATGRIAGDPQLGGDRHPVPGSPVVDAGDPEPLAPDEPFEDAAGVVRITDGDGTGGVRRDAGAYELQPPPVEPPAGNVLSNPGAEDGSAGWSGTFATAAFGDPFFPSAATGEALGAGSRFFAGGTAADPESLQRIDVAASAASIDAGGASAGLSGLLGGYGGPADGDTVSVRAVFRDPEGNPIGTALALGPVTPAERGNATNLLARARSGPIPARTRAIDVVIAGHRVAGGYTDAYADNLALVLSVPGAPVAPPANPDGPVIPNLKPFAGVTVLHPDARATRSGRIRFALACASATVGGCSGTLELRARLPHAKKLGRIARYASFSVAPGRRRGVHVKLLARARRALRRRTKIGTRLRTVASDGQGVQRIRTVPVKLRLSRRR